MRTVILPKTMTASAAELGITTKRLSRLCRLLEIPVEPLGTSLVLTERARSRIRRALDRNEIRRGRKKKAR